RSAVSPKRCQGARPAVHAAEYFRNTPMRIVARLASLILLPILALPLRAQDVQVGTALVCDTREQVERVVALYDGDFDAAVSTVNAEVQDPSAMASMTYLVSPPLAT